EPTRDRAGGHATELKPEPSRLPWSTTVHIWRDCMLYRPFASGQRTNLSAFAGLVVRFVVSRLRTGYRALSPFKSLTPRALASHMSSYGACAAHCRREVIFPAGRARPCTSPPAGVLAPHHAGRRRRTR